MAGIPPNFRQLLSQPTDQVERPKPLPTGHYRGEITNYEFGVSKNKQTPFVRFIIVPEEADADVDRDRLSGIDLSKKEMRKDFYITNTALYRLSDALDAILGQQQGRNFDERIPETRNAKILFGVTERQNEEGTETYNDVTTMVALA